MDLKSLHNKLPQTSVGSITGIKDFPNLQETLRDNIIQEPPLQMKETENGSQKFLKPESILMDRLKTQALEISELGSSCHI